MKRLLLVPFHSIMNFKIMNELEDLEHELENIQTFETQNLSQQFDPFEQLASFSGQLQTSGTEAYFDQTNFADRNSKQPISSTKSQNKSIQESLQTKIKDTQSQNQLQVQSYQQDAKKLFFSYKKQPTSADTINLSSFKGPIKRSLFSPKLSSKKKDKKLPSVINQQICNQAEEMFRANQTIQKVSSILNISLRAAITLRKQYFQTGKIVLPHSLQKKQKENLQRQKQNAQVKQTLKSLITKNCSITLKQMQKALKQKGIHRSKSTLHGYLQKMKYSRKKLQKVPIQRNSSNNIVYRQNYCKMIQQIPLQKQVFLDQTIFGLQTSGFYGWAPRGQQPKVLVPASRKKHITLLAAISIKGFQATQIIKGPVTSRHICDFLEHYLDHLEPDEVIILDNARMHHAAIVKSKIKELNRNIRYIPAYTPQLNPIQNVFSQIKAQYIRLKQDKELKNQQMIKLVEQSVKTMRSKEFSKYYQHYQKWLKLGISGQLFN